MKKIIALAFGVFMLGNVWAQQTEPITLSDVKCQVSISQNADLNSVVTTTIPANLKSQYSTFLKNLDQKGSLIEIFVDKNAQFAAFSFKNQGTKVKTTAEWSTYINQLQN